MERKSMILIVATMVVILGAGFIAQQGAYSGDSAVAGQAVKALGMRTTSVQASTTQLSVDMSTFQNTYNGQSRLSSSQRNQMEGILDGLADQGVIVRVISNAQLRSLAGAVDDMNPNDNDPSELVGGLANHACWTCENKHLSNSMNLNYCYHAC